MKNDAEAKRYRERLADLVKWFVVHRGDVDASAFNSACSEVLTCAVAATGLRVPAVVMEHEGLARLDAACALMGEQLPTKLLSVDCRRVNRWLYLTRSDCYGCGRIEACPDHGW